MKDYKQPLLIVVSGPICLQDSEMNVKRVKEGFQSGNRHNIPEDTIRELYPKSMSAVSQALPVADEAAIYNNSWEKPILIARKTKDGKVHVYPYEDERSKWTQSAINELIGINNIADL